MSTVGTATFHSGGLISGTDTQSIIDKMLEIRGAPMITMETEKTGLETDISAWADISTYMTALTDCLDTLRSWETWNTVSATASDDSCLKATATSSAAETSYRIFITRLAQAHSVGSGRAGDLETGATATTDLTDGASPVLTVGEQFTIEGRTITIAAGESLSSLRTKINTEAASMSAANRVTASILDNRLVITRVNSGTTQITMSDSSGTPLQDLHVLTSPGVYTNEILAAQNALFTVDGATVTRSSNTNLTDVIDNVTLNLENETTSTITLTVERDRETAKNAVLDFIEKYNALAAVLDDYGAIEVTGSDPKGATVDATGELYNDSLVMSIKNNIRKYATEAKPLVSLYNGYRNYTPPPAPVQVSDPSYTYKGKDGAVVSLADMGVGTSGRENKLSLNDEERLDYMLDNYFDQSEQLFRGAYDSRVGYTEGVATDFYRYADSVSASVTGEIARRTSTLTDKVDSLETRMSALEDDLAEYEQVLWEQFTTMEDTIASLQSDMQAVVSKLGSS